MPSDNVEIGRIIQEWTPEEGEPSDLMAYIKVKATIGNQAITLGTVIGVPEWQHGTCRAAGGLVDPFLSTWWSDPSDWQDVSQAERQDVEDALAGAAPRLWRETMAMRGGT
jgi:hypothetical protein